MLVRPRLAETSPRLDSRGSKTKLNSITGEIEQNHAYAWSTVMRVPSDAGMLFFKATAPETIYEIALTQKLAGWFPECMPELVAWTLHAAGC